MTDHQRGAYTPPTQDAPLSFDPRQPVRGARPIPFTLMLAILVLAALVGAIFYFYQSGVRQAGQAPQVVGAPTGDIKTPPPADAQPQEPAAGLQVYKEEQGAPLNAIPAQPTFTQGPEQPQARPTPPVTVTQAPPVTAPPTAQAAPPPAAIKPAIPAQQPPAAAPTPPPKVAAEMAPKIAAPPPAAKSAPAPAKTPPVAAKSEPAKPAAAKAEPAKPAPARTEPAKADAKPAAGGGAVVQIGAVSSSELAEKAWRDAVAVAPGLAAGKGKGVEKIDKNGATLYRTSVTGFASKGDAQAFCAKLQAAGKSCFVR